MTIRIPLNVYTCSVHEFKNQCRGRTYNRIFVRFNINIPSPAPLPPSQEIAFTLNIDKEEAEYFTTKHKPSLAQAEYGMSPQMQKYMKARAVAMGDDMDFGGPGGQASVLQVCVCVCV